MTTYLTPYELSTQVKTGSTYWRKRVLPVGSIDYQGKQIDFTPEYLKNMVSAFNDRAFDQVPLMLATDDNRHNNNPINFRGEVVSLDMAEDGLYATVTATDDGAEILQKNPRIGVSARIVNEYDRADGKHYTAAMQHALLTLDPRIPGLGGWESVENLSNDEDSGIINLTAEKFAGKKKTKKEKSVPDKDDKLSKDELAQLRALLTGLDASHNEDADETNEEVDEELTDEELTALLDALAEDDEAATADAEDAVDPELVEASNTGAKALELANEQATELSRIRSELDEQRWSNERESLMRKTGLSPAILDKAAPLLKGTGHVLEFANGDKVDAGAVMRDVITEVGKLAKLLDLSNELGDSEGMTPDTSEEAAARRDETTKAVRAMMGN